MGGGPPSIWGGGGVEQFKIGNGQVVEQFKSSIWGGGRRTHICWIWILYECIGRFECSMYSNSNCIKSLIGKVRGYN